MGMKVAQRAVRFAVRYGRMRNAAEAELRKALLDEVAAIQIRTKKSQDYTGASFREYSKAYARFRQNKGRNTTPDLLFTGKMLSNMRVRTGRPRNDQIVGEIHFGNPREAKKAEWNNNTREFFRLSNGQIERVKRRIKNAMLGAK